MLFLDNVFYLSFSKQLRSSIMLFSGGCILETGSTPQRDQLELTLKAVHLHVPITFINRLYQVYVILLHGILLMIARCAPLPCLHLNSCFTFLLFPSGCVYSSIEYSSLKSRKCQITHEHMEAKRCNFSPHLWHSASAQTLLMKIRLSTCGNLTCNFYSTHDQCQG